MTAVQSGPILTQLSYDSLSRLVTETTDGKTVGYQSDEAGNVTQLTYPSQLVVANSFDPLDRVDSVGVPTAPGSVATYGYRGTDALASETLGNGIVASFTFDAARRQVSASYRNQLGVVLGEGLSWSPRA